MFNYFVVRISMIMVESENEYFEAHFLDVFITKFIYLNLSFRLFTSLYKMIELLHSIRKPLMSFVNLYLHLHFLLHLDNIIHSQFQFIVNTKIATVTDTLSTYPLECISF